MNNSIMNDSIGACESRLRTLPIVLWTIVLVRASHAYAPYEYLIN